MLPNLWQLKQGNQSPFAGMRGVNAAGMGAGAGVIPVPAPEVVLDASDPATLLDASDQPVGDGEDVQRWVNKGTAGTIGDGLQWGTEPVPRRAAEVASMNGLGVLDSSSLSTCGLLINMDEANRPTTGAISIFLVARPTTLGDLRRLLGFTNPGLEDRIRVIPGEDERWLISLGDASGGVAGNHWGDFSDPMPTPAHLVSFTVLGGVWKTFINGVLVDESPYPYDRDPVTRLLMGITNTGGGHIAPSGSMRGYLGEYRQFSQGLGDPEMQVVAIDLMDKWGIAHALEMPGKPATPVATAATEVRSYSFRANWNASNDAGTYLLDVATDAAFTSLVPGYEGLDVAAATSYLVTALDPNTTYYYRVRATSLVGTSGNSNTVEVQTNVEMTFEPTDITDLGMWIDMADESTLFDAVSGGSTPAADGEIARAEDKSGNGRHATQTTADERPIRKVAERNGWDVAQFDGEDDYMDLAALGLLRDVDGYTAFAVVHYTGSPNEARRIIHISTGDGDTASRFSAINSGSQEVNLLVVRRLDDDTTALLPGDPFDNAFQISGYLVDYQNTNAYLHKNGVLTASEESLLGPGNTPDTDSVMTRLGAYNGPNQFWSGSMAELVIYNRVLTTQEREQVEQYLQNKWATPALPE